MGSGSVSRVFVLGLVFTGALSGCLGNNELYQVVHGGSFADPYGFTGRLDQGDMESMRDRMEDEFEGYSTYKLTLENQNGRAGYKVVVDGEKRCETVRERIGELVFIRSRSACGQVEEED